MMTVYLGEMHTTTAPFAAKADLGNGNVAVPDSNQFSAVIMLIEALDENFSRVTANIGHKYEGEDAPVSALLH